MTDQMWDVYQSILLWEDQIEINRKMPQSMMDMFCLRTKKSLFKAFLSRHACSAAAKVVFPSLCFRWEVCVSFAWWEERWGCGLSHITVISISMICLFQLRGFPVSESNENMTLYIRSVHFFWLLTWSCGGKFRKTRPSACFSGAFF